VNDANVNAAPRSDGSDGDRIDCLLGGRVRLCQPAGGQRAGSDAVLLAAAVPALPGQRVVELGTGSGAAALCLLARVPDLSVTGVELQAQAALAAVRNGALNGVAGRFRLLCADGTAPAFRRALGHAAFDHAFANPPFFRAAGRQAAAMPGREIARAERGQADLAEWIATLVHLVRPGGTVTLVQRTERLPELLAAFPGRPPGCGIAVAPLWPRTGREAGRVLVRFAKDRRSPFLLGPGLVLHGPAGTYLPAAEAILRNAAPVPEDAFGAR